MDDRRPDYRAEGQTIGAVGEGATAHFHQGFTAEDVLALLRALRLGGREALTRDGAGDVIVGQGDERVRISPSRAEALSQLPQHLPSDTPDQERHRLGALAQAIAGDLAPPVDFACLAREYAQRREEQGHPLALVEAAESLYVPLELRFYRALRPSEDDLYRREGRTYEDIRAAVEAPNPRSPQPQPFPALALLGDPGAGKSTSLRHLGLELMQEILEGEEPDVPILLFVSLGDHRQGRPVDFLAQEYGRWYGAKEFREESREEFWEVLQAGRLWLLADGLNEMPYADEEHREARVRDWRRFFKHDFPPGNRALVACRVADYGVGLDLPRLEVEPMDAERIQTFIARRFQTRPERGQRLWQELLDDRQARGPEHSLYGLVRNPFWLVVLVDVYGDPALERLPPNRAALVQCFVDRWLAYEADRPGGSALTGTQRAALQLALDRLAFHMLRHGQNVPLPRAVALSHLPERVSVAGDEVETPPRATLRVAQSACLLKARGRVETRRFHFYHHLLQEHFAGRELLRRFRLPPPSGRGFGSGGLDEADLWRIPWAEKWDFVESEWDPLSPPPTTGWEEATVLAAARAALEDEDAEYVGLAGRGDWPRLARAVLAHNPPLAARCLLEAGLEPAEEVRAELVERLRDVLQDPAATAGLEDPRQRLSLRVACGRALGALGDPRVLAGERQVVHPDGRRVRFILPAWSRLIPAGPFQMGSSRDDPQAYADEYSEGTAGRPHTVTIPHDYVVGRHPVTNAEYACFVDDGGYDQAAPWWDTDEARQWLRGELDLSEPWIRRWQQLAQWVRAGEVDPDQLLAQGRISPDYVETLKWAAAADDEELAREVREAAGASAAELAQPRFWEDRRYANPSQPVVGVCWYEARAYCAWLTRHMRASGCPFRVEREGQPEPWRVDPGTLTARLPTEAEWEKAARGGGQGSRRYPWGDEGDPAQANTLANTLEGRVLTTTPVGVYPDGAAPCGALDLAGNVWEWTSTRWGPEVERPAFGYPYDPGDGREDPGGTDLRVVRGGSWYNDLRAARCAARDGNTPVNRNNNRGFRVLLQLS